MSTPITGFLSRTRLQQLDGSAQAIFPGWLSTPTLAPFDAALVSDNVGVTKERTCKATWLTLEGLEDGANFIDDYTMTTPSMTTLGTYRSRQRGTAKRSYY